MKVSFIFSYFRESERSAESSSGTGRGTGTSGREGSGGEATGGAAAAAGGRGRGRAQKTAGEEQRVEPVRTVNGITLASYVHVWCMYFGYELKFHDLQ